MQSPDYLERYGVLLRLRQAAARPRNMIIAGALFGVSTLVALFSNLSVELNGRSLFFNAILIVCFALSFAIAWSRFDTLSGIVDLVDELEHAAREHVPTQV